MWRAKQIQRRKRGFTLLEGLIATGVLLIGLIGVLQGITIASQQNSIANRMTRGAAIGQQVAGGLLAKGRTRLRAGVLSGANCDATPDAALQALTSGLHDQTGLTICVADLDALDALATVPNQIVPGYDAEDAIIYRRILVYIIDPAQVGIASVAVVVSWTGAGRRMFHTQFVGLYDPAVNQTTIEL